MVLAEAPNGEEMSLLAVVAASEEHLAPIWMPIIWFAIIPAAAFILMGLITWSFRDVANRHVIQTHRHDEAAHQ
jgi:hypothetical protein